MQDVFVYSSAPLMCYMYVKFNPVFSVDYLSDEVPVKVHLEAFNPCIPLDSKNSGIPVIIFNYTVTNSSSDVAQVQIILLCICI